MKKWVKICLIVLCVLLVFEGLAWLFGYRINPFDVEKVTLYSYDQETLKYHSQELTEEEMWKIVLLYNYCTFHMGTERADGSTEPDCVILETKAGREIMMLAVRGGRLIIKPGYLFTSNRWLRDYINELLEKYNLPAWWER